MFVDGSKFRCCHGKQVDCGPGGLCFIAILPFIHRLWKIPVHLLWGLWDSTVFPILKMLAIFWWPRSSIRWPFWRLVFCAIWLDKIEQHLHDNRDAAGDLYPTCCRNATQDQSNEMAACRDPARANNYVRGRPLEAAAQEFRDRISGELNMFSVVSVLLATMTFTAFVTSPDVMVMRETSVTNATNNTQGQDTILQCYNGKGWASECVWLNGFLVCDFMSLTLSLIITGMYVRFSTVLRYCPTGKYVIWFIHRMEPAFALMHIFFMLSIHLAILSAGFYGWGVWKRITGPPLVIGLTAAAGVCLLYFEYSYANSMFCRDHGLCGVIGRILDHPTNVPDSPSVMYLIREFRLVLTEQPFNLYTHQVVGGEDRFTVKSDLDDCPCKDVDLTNIWFEDNIQVTLGCCGDHVILEPVVPGAAAPGGGAVATPVVPGAAAPGGGALLVAAPVVPGAPALGGGAMNGGGAVAAPVVPGAPALGGGAVNGGHPVGHCTVQ